MNHCIILSLVMLSFLFLSGCDNSSDKKTQNDQAKKIVSMETLLTENADNLKKMIEREEDVSLIFDQEMALLKLEMAEQKKEIDQLKLALEKANNLAKNLLKEMWTDEIDLAAFKKYKIDLEVPAIRVQLVEKPPVIDGQLDEVYKKNSKAMGFYPIKIISPDRTLESSISAYVVLDKEYLYIITRYETTSPMIMESTLQPRDSALWEKDCIDIFIDPSGTGSEYYHIITNASGALYDAKQSNTQWNPNIKVKCGIEEDKAWLMEMRIPLKDIGVNTLELNKSWSFNINFFIPKEDEGVPDIDLAWSPTGTDSSHVPEMFGKLWMTAAGRPKEPLKK